jgi:hypothetical protein
MTDFTVPASELLVPSSNLTVDDTLTNYLSSLSPSDQAALDAATLFAQQNANSGTSGNQTSFTGTTANTTQTNTGLGPRVEVSSVNNIHNVGGVDAEKYFNDPSYRADIDQWRQTIRGTEKAGDLNDFLDYRAKFLAGAPGYVDQFASTTSRTPISDTPFSAEDEAIIQQEAAAAAAERARLANQSTAETNRLNLTPTGLETLVPAGGDQTQTQIQTQPADTNPVDAGQTSGWDSGDQTLQYAGNDFGNDFGGGWGQESSYDSNYRGKGGGYVSNFKNAQNLDFYKSGLTHHADGGLMALARGGMTHPFFSKATGKYNFHPAQMYAGGGMPVAMAMGGLGTLGGYSDGGRLLKGPGDGVSDSIPATIGQHAQPARLADGEFVIPARIVSELGNGSTDAGARKLYAMMDRVQRTRSKTVGKDRVAVNSRADKNLPA